MAERAVRVHRIDQAQQHQPNRYHRIQQQRRAIRELPLCIPRLFVAWIAFGIGVGSVLLSLCLMIGGAASSATVYGGRGSVNLSAVYVGVVFLILGLASLIVFGVQFARVRNSQKEEIIRADSGHENAAFPVSEQPDAIPMTSTYLSETTAHGYTQPALSESPKDSAYSSIAMGSVAGSELNARRLSDANSSSMLIPSGAPDSRNRPFSRQMGASTTASAPHAFPTSRAPYPPTQNSVLVSHNSQLPQSSYPKRPVSKTQGQFPASSSHDSQRPHSSYPERPISQGQGRAASHDSQRPHSSYPERPISQGQGRAASHIVGNYAQRPHTSQATSRTELPRSAVVMVERHENPSHAPSDRRMAAGVTRAPIAANPMISTDPMSIQPMDEGRNENRRRPMPPQSSSSLVI